MRTFESLPQFYQSKEWRKFRHMIIAERTNKEDGILYDEHNGQPLLKPYDIILHHKIELTLQNVNDRSISLNPDNIMVVSMASHNEIHKRFGGRLQPYQRKVYYVYGSPLSGKSTYVKEHMNAGDLVVDIDTLWQSLSGQPEYIKPHQIKPIVFSVMNTLIDNIKTRMGSWENAWIIEGGARLGDRMRRLATLGAEPIFIDTSKDECLIRLEKEESRAAVKEEWRNYINEWFKNYQPDVD